MKRTFAILAAPLLAVFLGAWIHGYSIFPFAGDGDDWPTNWSGGIYDATNNVEWLTWASFNGSNRFISSRLYNKTTGDFGAKITISSNPNSDAHGAPTQVMDQYGYVHELFGSHVSNVSYSYTTNPRSNTSWTAGTAISCGCTFGQALLLGGAIYYVTDTNTNGHQDVGIFSGTPSSGGGVPSFSAVANITNCGNFACWFGNNSIINGKICIPFYYTNDVIFDDVYYGCWNPSDGSFCNLNASTCLTSAQLPMTRATAQADFAVYLSPTSPSSTGFGVVQVTDSQGTIHVLFANGAAAGNSFTIYESHWTGSAWSVPVGAGGATMTSILGEPNVTASSDGGFDFYYQTGSTTIPDLWTVHWSPTTEFGTPSLFFKANLYGLLQIYPVTNNDMSLGKDFIFNEVNNPNFESPQPFPFPPDRIWLNVGGEIVGGL